MPLMPPRPALFVGLLIVAVSWSPRLVGQQPRDPEDFVLAVGLIERGLHAEAAEKLTRFLRDKEVRRNHPKAGEAWYRLGVCRSVTEADDGDPVEAFRKALKTRGFKFAIEARYRLASTLQERGETEGATREFKTLRDALPNQEHYLTAAIWFGLGECLRESGDDASALTAFSQAANRGRANGGDGERYVFFGAYQAGFAQLRLEQFEAAEKAFRTLGDASDGRPELAEIRFFEGDAAYRAGHSESAQRAWRACTKLAGARADEAWYGLGWCAIDAEDAERAETCFRRVVREFPRSSVASSARLEVGRLQQARGAQQEAVETLAPLTNARQDEAVADAQLVSRAHEIRAAALLALGDADGARQSFERVAADASASGAGGLAAAGAQYGIAESFAARGAWAEAVAAYDRAKSQSGDDRVLAGDAAYGAIVGLHELGDFSKSVTRAEAFAREFPEHPMAAQAAFALAEGAFAAGDHARALAAYDQLPTDHPQAALVGYKSAWAASLARADDDTHAAGEVADRFEQASRDSRLDDTMREEALSMVVWTRLQADDPDRALTAANRYRERYGKTASHLARTERVAGRVLRARGELDAAARRFARAAAAETDRGAAAQLELERADIAYQRGDFEAARALYEEAADREDAAGARALEGLAWCAFELGDGEVARAAIDRVRSRAEKPDPAVLAGIADLSIALAHQEQDWALAVAEASRFLESWPQHERAAEAKYSLGIALARQGEDLERARTVLRELLASDAESSAMRGIAIAYEFAWVCRQLEDEKGTRKGFAAVLAIADRDADGEGSARSADDRPALADRLVIDRVGEARYELAIVALAGKDLSEAQRASAKTALEEVSGRMRGDALYRLGFMARDAEDLGEATRCFEQLARLSDRHPLHAEACFLAAECGMIAKGEDWAQHALGHLDALLERNGQAVDDEAGSGNERMDAARLQRVRLYAGQCALETQQAGKAVSLFETFLARATDPTDGEAAADSTAAAEQQSARARAQLWLGRAHAERGDAPRATQAWKAAAGSSDGPIGAEAQFRLGEIQERAGDFEGATEAYVKLSILYAHEPWVPRGLLGAVRCYEALDQQPRADRFRAELQERYPNFRDSKRPTSR